MDFLSNSKSFFRLTRNKLIIYFVLVAYGLIDVFSIKCELSAGDVELTVPQFCFQSKDFYFCYFPIYYLPSPIPFIPEIIYGIIWGIVYAPFMALTTRLGCWFLLTAKILSALVGLIYWYILSSIIVFLSSFFGRKIRSLIRYRRTL